MENGKAAPRRVPLRQCAGCMEHFPKKQLIRLVRTPEGAVELDLVGKKSGRGVYICKSAECFRKARKARRFERGLDCRISDDIYAEMEKQIEASEHDG